MDYTKTKNINALLAGIALAGFLFLNFVSFHIWGRRIGTTGLELLKSSNDGPNIMFLWIIMPVIAIIGNLASNKPKLPPVFAGLMFLAPVVYMVYILGSMKGDYEREMFKQMTFGLGFYVYLLASIAMTVLAIVSMDKKTNLPRAVLTPEVKTIHNDEVRQKYSENQLNEIISNPNLYNPEMVERCKQELSIRQEAATMIEQIRAYTDERIAEVLRDKSVFSPALIYACQEEYERRAKEKSEKRRMELHQRQKEEMERKAQETEERRQMYVRLWQKYRWILLGAIVFIFVISILAYIFSNGRYYSKGVQAFENGDYDGAIEWLSGVGSGYDNYTDANWLLYQIYLNKQDSAAAATALQNAVENGQWDKHPAAFGTYCAHQIRGTFQPYISVDELKAASLMKDASEDPQAPIVVVTAGELYFKHQQWEDAYNCFTKYALDSYGYAGNMAKGYIGMYYLYGLYDKVKDVKEACKYFKNAPDNAFFVPFKTYTTLSQMTHPDYTMVNNMAETIKASQCDMMLPTCFVAVAELLQNAYDKHAHEGFLTVFDSGWNEYTFNNGKGSYKGEFAGSLLNGGGANGWGFFTNQYTSEDSNQPVYYVAFGKHRYTQKACPRQGLCVASNYYPETNRIIIWAGIFENDKLADGIWWTNDEIGEDEYNKNIKLPF